jgi:hypothetical protein
MKYTVLVRYRTRSGINAVVVDVDADSAAAATQNACAKVERRRGVVRVDSAETINFHTV